MSPVQNVDLNAAELNNNSIGDHPTVVANASCALASWGETGTYEKSN
jgi:hypothetical protein